MARAEGAEVRAAEAERALGSQAAELARARSAEAAAAQARARAEALTSSLSGDVERTQAALVAREGELEARMAANQERSRGTEELLVKASKRAEEAAARAKTAEDRAAQAEARATGAEGRAAKLAAEVARRNEDGTRLASAHTAQEESLRRLREELRLLQSERDELAHARAQAETQAERAKGAGEEAEARAAALDSELQAARRECDQIQQRLGAAVEERAKESAEGAARMRTELDARSAELANLQRQAEDREKVLRRLLAEKDAHAAHVAERDQRIALLQQEATAKTDRLKQLAQEILAAESARRALLRTRRWLRSAALATATAALLFLALLVRRPAPPHAGSAPSSGPLAAVAAATKDAPAARAEAAPAPAAPIPATPAPGTLASAMQVPATSSPATLAAATADPPGPGVCSCTPLTYRVRAGDRLWDISMRYYQNPRRWRWLFQENRDRVADPDVIFPGQRLSVPARRR